MKNIIGKKAYIKNGIGFDNCWGIIKFTDGESYWIAMFDDQHSQQVFSRDEFVIKREA